MSALPLPPDARPLASARVSRRVLAAILIGTLLNPLNSSMIAVALGSIRRDFGVDVVAVAWLISSFYLVAAVGQSVLGRLVDQLGPRRLFCAGFAIVAVAGVLGPLAPSYGWLIVARLLLAVGTSAGFPAGLALLRNATHGKPPPPATLAAVTIAGSATAALGPVVGGLLVSLASWPAIFLVNVAVAAIGLPLALRWLPHDPQHAGGLDWTLVRRTVDLPGIGAFTLLLGSVLALLLSLAGDPLWWLAPAAVLGAALLVASGRRRADPFLDLRVLAADRRLLGVLVQYLLVNVVAFGVFFAVPIWLESARGQSAGETGLLMAPLAGVAVIATPLAARLVARRGIRPALTIGACAMVAGTLLLLTCSSSTPALTLVAVAIVLGIPIGFNNLGLQAALYAVSPPERTGAAAGLFQTCRFTGAVLATSTLGLVFADGVDDAGLHEFTALLVGVSVVVLAASMRRPRSSRHAA